MLLASATDTLILSGIITEQVNIITASSYALLIAICESAFVLFLLGRPRNVALRASPPFGWTLGLGIGAMQSSVLAFRLFDEELNSSLSGFSMYSVAVCLLISVTACTGHAVLSAYQGAMILEPQRWALLLYLHTQGGIVNFLNTFNIHSTDPCRSINCNYRMGSFTERWLPSGLTPARQAYRRTTRQSERHKSLQAPGPVDL